MGSFYSIKSNIIGHKEQSPNSTSLNKQLSVVHFIDIKKNSSETKKKEKDNYSRHYQTALAEIAGLLNDYIFKKLGFKREN